MAEQVSAKLTVISGSGDGTKGSYVEIFSSTNFKCNWLEIVLVPTTALQPHMNIDVAVGAAASEVDKIVEAAWVMNQSVDGGTAYAKMSMPLEFASGVRLAVRMCDTSGSAISYQVQVRIISY